MRLTPTVLVLLSFSGACLLQPVDPQNERTEGATDEDTPESGALGFDPGETTCMPTDTMETFGLCVCDSFQDVGELTVVAAADDMPASVGVNGTTDLVSQATIEGTWHAYAGLSAVAAADIAGDLVTTGEFDWLGVQQIRGNLVVGKNVSGVGQLEIGGSLDVGGDVNVTGTMTSGSEGSYVAPAGPPCPCSGDTFFDVVAAVDDARDNNDNATIGLSPDGLVEVGATELVLPTGKFYVANMLQVGALTLNVQGNAALYVDGDLATVGDEMIQLAEGASLDLYVAGSVASVGQAVAGSMDRAADFRLLIGGDDGVVLSVGTQPFFGHIYAPTAELSYVGDTQIYGSLFADRLSGVGRLTITHVSAAVPPEEVCEGDTGVPR